MLFLTVWYFDLLVSLSPSEELLYIWLKPSHSLVHPHNTNIPLIHNCFLHFAIFNHRRSMNFLKPESDWECATHACFSTYFQPVFLPTFNLFFYLLSTCFSTFFQPVFLPTFNLFFYLLSTCFSTYLCITFYWGFYFKMLDMPLRLPIVSVVWYNYKIIYKLYPKLQLW